MALHIKDAETDRLARELAEVTGETITRAVYLALQERLIRLRLGSPKVDLVDDLARIAERGATWPTIDRRSADEILGYDEDGLPR